MRKKHTITTTSKYHQKQNKFNNKKSVQYSRKNFPSYAQLIEQLHGLRGTLILYAAFGLSGILITFLLSHITGMPFSYLSRDMAAICNVKETIGFLSNMGIILWSSTAAICMFSAVTLRKIGGNRQTISFFLYSGLLTFWFLIDDLFLFHDRVFPDYLNIPEKGVHGSYACITIVYVVAFLKDILSTDYILLIMAGFFLAASMLMDILFVFGEGETIIEDSLKFLGVTFWLGYFYRAALLKIKGCSN